MFEYFVKVTNDESGKTIIGGTTEFLEYIFTLNIEENCKISNQNRFDYLNMAVYVRTVSGKPISIKCDRQQKAARILEIVDQGMVLNGKKTIEENNIEAGTTIEMSLRTIGGMEKEEQMETTKTEKDLKS